ncbi:MAG TPA: protein translocase subunit SecD [Acidimicrobiales bacterium]
MRRFRGYGSLIAIVAIAAGALFYTLVAGNKPLLGLDLQGGVSVVLQPKNAVDSSTIDEAISIIRQRVDALGVAEPEITRQGDNILIQIPGVKDKDRAIALVGQTAELQFRPVLTSLDPSFLDEDTTDTSTTTTVDPNAPTTTADPNAATTTVDPNTATATTSVPAEGDAGTTSTTVAGRPGAEAKLSPDACATGTPSDVLSDTSLTEIQVPLCEDGELTAVLVVGPVGLTGNALDTARATLGPDGKWTVSPVFKGGDDGIGQFNAIASQCFQKAATCPTGQLAAVLDGKVITAPTINAPVFSADQIEISGSFTESEAKDVALKLKYGALPVELEQQQAQIVSATLGRDALHAGLVAGLVGLILVTIYMVAFYRILGVLSILKLAVEGALLWSVISWLGSNNGLALTLAGITGIIVSIGVSLDSNVVYYEHLKEDVLNGRSIRSATDKAFRSSFSTIVKADVASLIGATLLWWLTVGPVRGFAFYLALSTLLDLLCSWAFMRPGVRLVTHSRLAGHLGWLGIPAPREAPSDGPPPASRPKTGALR